MQQNELLADFFNMYEAGIIWDNRPAVWPNVMREPTWQRDLIAVRLMPVIGERSVLLPRSGFSNELLRFLEASGFSVPTNAVAYGDDAERLQILNKLAETSSQAAIQLPLPYSDVPASVYAVDRELLLYLNNKANLTRLLPENVCRAENSDDGSFHSKWNGFLTLAGPLKSSPWSAE